MSRTDKHFYSRYDWCLNAILSVRELLREIAREFDTHRVSEGWQREKCRINLYLFAGAIACSADDYFAESLLDLSVLRSRLSGCQSLPAIAERFVITAGSRLKILGNWRTWRWRKRRNSSQAEICNVLISGGDLELDLSTVLYIRLRERLLRRKMRLAEAFRLQDFTHRDVISLIERFCASSGSGDKPITVLGLRTSGAYFAPLMAAWLTRSIWHRVSWFSIRPAGGISALEAGQLDKARRQNARILLGGRRPLTWSDSLFFLDLDVVFDQERLGFSSCHGKRAAIHHAPAVKRLFSRLEYGTERAARSAVLRGLRRR